MAISAMPVRVDTGAVPGWLRPWQQMTLLSVVYILVGTFLVHLIVTIGVMIVMPRPEFTWARSAAVYPFTHALRGFAVSGVVLFGILASRPVAPSWRRVLKSAGWATAYALLAGAFAFFLQLYVVNRRIGGWNQVGPDRLLWVTPFQHANPRAVWFALSGKSVV